jgi:penicillin amidase
MADAGGHIAYRTAGRIPLRSEINQWLPVPGWVTDHDWTGFIPDDDLPRAHDPAVGAIVTANQRVTERSYPYTLGIDAYPGHRAERIWDRLGHAVELTAADLAAIHVDVVSSSARRLADRVEGQLGGWDGEMRDDSVHAALYAVARDELVREVTAGLPAALLANPFAAWEPPATAFPPALRVANAIDNWIANDDTTFLPSAWNDWAEAFGAALERAVPLVAARTWGELHRFTPLRLGSSARLDLGGVAGGAGCVMATNQISGVSLNALVGSTARYVWDLADRARSGWVVPHGASGDDRSPHAGDQFELWRTGRLLPAFD